jgi:hypothetical protein
MLSSVIIVGKMVTRQKSAERKSATKTIKSGKPPAVHQSILLKISPANDVIFRAVSAMPKTTDLMNVLDWQKFANVLQIPTAQLIARHLYVWGRDETYDDEDA